MMYKHRVSSSQPPTPEDYRTPGQFLEACLEQRGWTKRILAIILGCDETVINKLIAGKRRIDAEMALALGDLLGVLPEFLLELQQRYDLAQARIVMRPDPARNRRAHLYGELPVADMIRRGWIDADDVRDVRHVERALSKFFGVQHASEIEILPHAAKKTAVAGGDVTAAQLAWIYRVQQITTDTLTAQYSPSAVQDAISKLSKLLQSPEEARKVPRILAEAGIRYAIVESLPAAKIDGVCLWIDLNSPVIGMSMRFDRIDNFWFVLRHELEHVIQKHGQTAMIIDDLEGDRSGTGADIPEEERIANGAAGDFCVPRSQMDSFIARKAPYFAERDILGFAATIQVHPGLVAGQLQRRTHRYDRFRSHLVKIRHCVAPGALVDGWGDVFPVEQ